MICRENLLVKSVHNSVQRSKKTCWSSQFATLYIDQRQVNQQPGMKCHEEATIRTVRFHGSTWIHFKNPRRRFKTTESKTRNESVNEKLLLWPLDLMVLLYLRSRGNFFQSLLNPLPVIKKCHQEDTNIIIGSMVLLWFHSRRTRDKKAGDKDPRQSNQQPGIKCH